MEFYKANKANKGCGLGLSYDSKRDGHHAIFFDLIKQNGWNPKANRGKGAGIFKGGVQNKIKISPAEAGFLIKSIKEEKSLSDINGRGFYHDTKETVNTIDFNAYKKDGSLKGFTFSISKTIKGESKKTQFTIGLTVGEAEIFRVWLEDAVSSIFNGMKSLRIKKYEDATKSKSAESSEGGDVKEDIPF